MGTALTAFEPLFATNLNGTADWSTVVATIATITGLWFVVLQLVAGNRATRAQTTIAFQQRFKESQKHRDHVFNRFPLHRSLGQRFDLDLASDETEHGIRVWEDLEDLSDADCAAADGVINALNDVAQYVVDGITLKSALQQYHTIFLRVFAVLEPYLLARNRTVEGQKQARFGRRVPILFNVALAYQQLNPIHSDRTIDLVRTLDSGVTMTFQLVDENGEGMDQFVRFPDSPKENLMIRSKRLKSAIRKAEATLRE